MMAVRVTSTVYTFEAETPVALFSTRIRLQTFNFQYVVSKDGRFLVSNRDLTDSVSPITVVLNWRS